MKVYAFGMPRGYDTEKFLKNLPVGPGEEVTVTRMKRYVKCSICGTEHYDEGSVVMVEKWLTANDHYAPCPNLNCMGEMQILTKEERL